MPLAIKLTSRLVIKLVMKIAMKIATFSSMFGVFLVLNACSIDPTSIVKTPTSAKPATTQTEPAKNGGIFVASNYKPMFEDRRPRFVGDILTINLVENTRATKAGASSSSKVGSVAGSITSLLGKSIPLANVAGSSSNSLEEAAAADTSNVFTGTVGVTVIEVLPNGFLVVSGQKQIALDKGTEFVRFSGVVNPDSITRGNVVPSNRVADARIEYRSNSTLDTAGVISILSRFFFSFNIL